MQQFEDASTRAKRCFLANRNIPKALALQWLAAARRGAHYRDMLRILFDKQRDGSMVFRCTRADGSSSWLKLTFGAAA